MSLSPEQLAVRKMGIGSSDIAALCGLHAYRSRMDVFNEKVFGTSRKPTPEMDFGNDVEAAVLRFRAREVGGTLCDDETYAKMFADQVLAGRTIRDVSAAIALTTPDAVLLLPDHARIIESKAVGAHEAYRWGDEDNAAPIGYQIQCVWHMGVSGIHECDLVASIAGQPPATWAVEWNADRYANLVEIAEQFWTDHVLPRVKPDPIDGSDASDEYLRRMYPEERSPMRAATPLEEEHAALYVAARAQEKQGAAAKDYAGNVLRESLGDATGCLLANNEKVTWKKQKNGTRVLQVTEPKAKGK